MFRDLGYMYYRWEQGTGMQANTEYEITFYDFNGANT